MQICVKSAIAAVAAIGGRAGQSRRRPVRRMARRLARQAAASVVGLRHRRPRRSARWPRRTISGGYGYGYGYGPYAYDDGYDDGSYAARAGLRQRRP